MKKRKKQPMTLLEVMIVIFIIGIIGSVIGYNMRGSMDQGKAFKTKEGIYKVYNIVQLEIDSGEIQKLEGKPSSDIEEEVGKILEQSGLISKPQDYLVDGWKNPLEFNVEHLEGGYEIRMKSVKYEAFCQKKGKKPDYPWEFKEEEAY